MYLQPAVLFLKNTVQEYTAYYINIHTHTYRLLNKSALRSLFFILYAPQTGQINSHSCLKKPFHTSSLNPVNAFSPCNPIILFSTHPHGLSFVCCQLPNFVFLLYLCCLLCFLLPVSFVHTCQCQSVLIVVVVNNVSCFVLLHFFIPPTPYVINTLLCLTCLFIVVVAFVFFSVCTAVVVCRCSFCV